MKLPKLDLLLGIIGLVFALVVGFVDHSRLTTIFLAAAVLVVFAIRILSNWTPFLHPRKIDLSQFLTKIPREDLVSIKVICHTGKYAYMQLQAWLEGIEDETAKRALHIAILARFPLVESTNRANDIVHTHEMVQEFKRRHFDIDIRYYQSLPAHRAVICQYANGSRKSYISAYEWVGPKSRGSEWVYVVRDRITSPNQAVKSIESWIEHYWGKGVIHTLVFDFDDTLALTRELQITAWVEAIEIALKDGTIKANELAPNLIAARENPQTYQDAFRQVFLEQEMAEQIMDAVLPQATSTTRSKIEKNRNLLRKRNLETAGGLFPGVREKLDHLSNSYQLVIITATYSGNVCDFLKLMNVLDKFSLVLGKEEAVKYRWENVHNKSAQLLEVSGLVGVPLDRLVFIGDNTSDYRAANQIGVAFIEATQAATSVRRSSLIKPSALDPSISHRRFDDYRDGSLDSALKEIEQEKRQTPLRSKTGLPS